MFEIEFKTKEKPLTTRVRGKRLRHFISVPSIREVWVGLTKVLLLLLQLEL